MSGTRVAAPSLVPVARPSLGPREADAVRRPIEAHWLTQGREVARFEEEFAAYVGAPHACAVSNGTTALHLALRAAGVGPGDEVLTVSHSFIATANAVRYCGGIPVFVDVEPGEFNMDPARLDDALSRRTRAVLVVHQLGMPCNLPPIVAWARGQHLPVIEDAACAAGSALRWEGRWERIGRPHGQVACFSFHPRKVLTTGEGGMLTTADPEWDRRFRLWRQHAMSVPDTARHDARDVVFEDYVELGFNYRMTDLQAAIGREQLARLSEMVAERRRLAGNYDQALGSRLDVRLPREPEWARTNWQSYCIVLPPSYDQRRVMQAMLDDGIATRRGVMCAHQQPAYDTEPWRCAGQGPGGCGCSPRTCRALPHSEAATATGVILPLFVGMTADEQARVIAALTRALDEEARHA